MSMLTRILATWGLASILVSLAIGSVLRERNRREAARRYEAMRRGTGSRS